MISPDNRRNSIESIEIDRKRVQSSLKLKSSPKMLLSQMHLAFKEWAVLSSAQCIPKIFQYDNKAAKVLFLILLLIFTFATFWFFIQGIFDYLEFDVISKIRVYSEETLIYPVISFCDANPFTSKDAELALKDYDRSKHINLYSLVGLNETEFIGDSKIQTFISKFFVTFSYGMYKAFDLNDKQKLELSNSLMKRIQYCIFNAKPCVKNDFSWYFSYLYGNCFSFNSNLNSPKGTTLGGSMYGLILLIGNITNENKISTFYASGLKILIHNDSYLTSSTKQTLAETGKLTNIEIKKTFTYRQPFPYSDCIDLTHFRSDLYDQIKNSSRKYHQNDCFELCMQKQIIEKCECFHFSLPFYQNNSVKPCFSTNQSSCAFRLLLEFKANLDRQCKSECPLECDYVTYDLSSSTLNFPNEEYFADLKQDIPEYGNMSLEEYKQKHIVLNIFYSNKEYTEIRETPTISTIDLISNLGGVMGIFLGLSIFTFIEILELMFQILILWCK